MQLPNLFSPLLHLALNSSYSSTRFTDTTIAPCPWLGQIYPPPTAISAYSAWQNALPSLHDAINAIPSVSNNLSSHAVQIVSLHEAAPLFEHYAKASNHNHGKDGTAHVDENTLFRIASTTKAYTVYALLLKCGFRCFEDPITKYVPELRDQVVEDRTQDTEWDEITVGALAAQLSGLGRDYALGDLSGWQIVPVHDIGLPDIDPAEAITCSTDANQPPCSREESIKLMLQHPPAFPVYYTPSYSNMAFQLLSYVLQNITGQGYEELMVESVFKPLNLDNTTLSLPDLADGIIEDGDPTFEWDLGDDAATGGMYSSVKDLATFARHILNHTQLSPSQTRRWLKPHSFTSHPQFSFGAPWEIIRLPGVSTFHTIDVYTKSGTLGTWRSSIQYTTLFALIPDLEVALIVASYASDALASAPPLALTIAQQALGPMFDIAKAQALRRFGGIYIDERLIVNSSMTISADDEIGLVISEFISNGTDVLAALRGIPVTDQALRIFPATLSSRDNKRGTSKLAFRANIISADGMCQAAFLADALKYGGIGLDLVVFDTEIDGENAGEAFSVELPAFRTKMLKVRGGLNVQ